jgi:hypothetical protein
MYICRVNRLKPCLIFCVLLRCGFVFAQEDPQIAFALERFKAIPQADLSEIEGLCLTADEFLDLARQIVGEGNPAEQDIMEDVRKGGNGWIKQYAKDYYGAFTPSSPATVGCDSVNWNTVEVDSVCYEYSWASDGEAGGVGWPESKNFVFTGDRFILNQTAIYFHDGKHKHLVHFHFVLYNGRWRLTRGTKAPVIACIG